MAPLEQIFVALICAAVGIFILWVVIRSAVEWGIIRAAQRMRKEGWAIPTKAVGQPGRAAGKVTE